ncbi:hypothetical protein [Ramlibacter rhizophilus]|uniref:Uncharacterized protein n=1 Tax=Ramlibacter rhizophilus TaxID=1781167 RepID=A0A4Z0BC24_9BURK|nr:hypothetical protein [Ramlibacter rhizophilus]TFY96765.1 hypothetical protein EZ242_18955 [Ramlibacter rhizophilus]
MDAKTLVASFGRILASDQPDHEMRRQLLEQLKSAMRSKSMTAEVLQQVCALVLGSRMPRDSQRYFLSAAFDACRDVLALDDVIALRKAISGQGWETIAALQTLASLYGAGADCLTRESALAEWAAAKAAHPRDLPLVRLWIREALERHASRSEFS